MDQVTPSIEPAHAPAGSRPPMGPGSGPDAQQWRIARRSLTVLGVLGVGSLIGVAASLYLANHAPLLLIALSPISRHLILVAPTVNPVAFVVVAVSRRAVFSLACFYLGRALGSAAIEWLQAHSPRSARFVRWLERLFQRASHLVVFALPGPAVSAIAGDAGMHAGVFLTLLTAGLVLRMLLVLWIGEAMRGPIEVLLAWIREYWLPGTVVMIAGIALYHWRQQRREGMR